MTTQKKIILDDIQENTAPTFSIIVPTYGEYEGLGRTLVNIILQSEKARNALREILVVGDGFEQEAYDACAHAQKYADEEKQNAKVWYFNVKAHTGSGNIPRAAGLKKARQDWVLFLDAGTSVMYNAFATLIAVIQKYPDAKLLTWDMVQLLDPVPVTTVAALTYSQPRDNGLSYVIPGCAAAIKRELAQVVEWPNVPASDWAYFSSLWEHNFGPPPESNETKERVEREVVVIPWVLTAAYAARAARKIRLPITAETFDKLGYSRSFQSAKSTIEEHELNGTEPGTGENSSAEAERTADPEPVQSA